MCVCVHVHTHPREGSEKIPCRVLGLAGVPSGWRSGAWRWIVVEVSKAGRPTQVGTGSCNPVASTEPTVTLGQGMYHLYCTDQVKAGAGTHLASMKRGS